MIDLAKALIIGRLTQDPEIRYTPKGMAVATMRVAVNHRGRDRAEESSFFDVVAFGKLAETCGEYLSKGRVVLVDGRLRERRWESKEGRRSRLEIVASTVEFLDPPPESAVGAGPGEAGRGGSGGPGGEDEEPPF
jgi:single-strand DNA-binding protein